jgi:hypothetical protein
MERVVWGLAFVVACGARTELLAPEEVDASVKAHDAGVDHFVHDASFDAGEDVFTPAAFCVVPDAGVPTTTCTRPLQAGTISPSSVTCFVDTVVKTGDLGTLTYACNGDPSILAVATFDGGTFTGTIQGTTVSMCTGTAFPWSDGCTWSSAQHIAGDIDSGALAFTYAEQPIVGHNCESPCSAQGVIEVK